MFLLIVAVYFFITNVEAQPCHQDWLYYDGSCYGFGEDKIPFADAQVMCISFDSKLAEIETSAENEFLKSMATTKQGIGYWIGATDIFHEGVWEWVSTRQNIVSFTDWAVGNPSDSGEGQDCLLLDKNFGYKWNDIDCEIAWKFICEASPLEEPVVG